MALSWRSVGTGLLAACLAFLVAYFINPVHLGVLGVVLLILSGLIGFFASVTLGKKFSRQDSDQRTAIMVFAFLFFVGIYAPITAIWANAPFYSWSITVKEKPKSEILAPILVTALEKTATSTYLGLFALFGFAYVFPKYMERKSTFNLRNEADTAPHFGWVDIALGIFALLQSFIGAFLIFHLEANLVNVFALISLTFLQVFLFRSFRLQCKSLWKKPPRAGVQRLNKAVGAILILCLALCIIGALLVFSKAPSVENSNLSGNIRLFAMCTVVLLLPLPVYRLFVRSHPENDDNRIALANHFAIRCGSWALLGMFLIIGGLVLRGLGQKELNSAPPQFVTPFAYSILALTPVWPSGAFLFLFAPLGGFFVALVLPHDNILARQRILASAQGGAVGGAVFFNLLIVMALSLSICTVPCIPLPNMPQNIDMHSLQILLASGRWPLLGFLYVLMSFCWVASVASIWAIEAMFACAIVWIKELF